MSKPKRKWVTIAFYANRPGRPIHKPVLAFVRRLAIAYGHPLTITCGTRHNQFVKGTHRQSQHWTGDAADIGMSGAALTRLGHTALIVAGAKPSWARQQAGGAFTIHGVNILFNTTIGGNHYNHLHVGLTALPPGFGSGVLPGSQPGEGPSAPAPPETPPAPVKLPARVRINKPWDRLMQALDPELKARGVTVRQVGRHILDRVK